MRSRAHNLENRAPLEAALDGRRARWRGLVREPAVHLLVAEEVLPVLVDVCREGVASDLLLPFDDEVDRAGELSLHVEDRLEGGEVRAGGGLVVLGAPRDV